MQRLKIVGPYLFVLLLVMLVTLVSICGAESFLSAQTNVVEVCRETRKVMDQYGLE